MLIISELCNITTILHNPLLRAIQDKSKGYSAAFELAWAVQTYETEHRHETADRRSLIRKEIIMGVFSRLTDIINSNVNAILDRAEDPQKIIRLIVQEMEETLVEVRSTTARTIAERKEIDRRLRRIHEAQAEWDRKAEIALRKGREDLSRAALIEKAKLTGVAKPLQEELDAIESALARGDQDIAKLEAKLREAKAKQQAMVTREQAVSNRLRVRKQTYDPRIDNAFARFESLERRIDRAEGEVEVFELGQRKTLAEEIADLEANASVEAELDALKTRISGSTTPSERS